MKQTKKILKNTLLVFLVLITVLVPISFQGTYKHALALNVAGISGLSPFFAFGGRIEETDRRWCLIYLGQVGPFPIIIPYPFRYLVIGTPVPAEVDFVYGIPGTKLQPSKSYPEFQIHQEQVWSLGTYLPEAGLWRNICMNKDSLNSDAPTLGIVRVIGTSCPLGGDEDCTRSSFDDLTDSDVTGFDPKAFPDLCSGASKPEECLPVP